MIHAETMAFDKAEFDVEGELPGLDRLLSDMNGGDQLVGPSNCPSSLRKSQPRCNQPRMVGGVK
jgi:hypothetical protein